MPNCPDAVPDARFRSATGDVGATECPIQLGSFTIARTSLDGLSVGAGGDPRRSHRSITPYRASDSKSPGPES